MITKATAQDEPMPSVGPLHSQAIAIRAAATGQPSELNELTAIAAQATGEEAEAIGWQIEGWIAQYGAALIPTDLPE